MIVGSGVVGCYLGKLLGEQEIWEKNRKLVEKPCSSLLSKTGLNSLDLDYSDCVLNEIRGAVFHSEYQQFVIEKNSTQAYVLNRLKLQKELAKEAQEQGCRIIYDKPWNGQSDDFVLGADGALSSVARSMGIKREYIKTYQVKVELKKRTDSDLVELYFGKHAPGFFGWKIPFDEKRAEIGLGLSHGNPKHFFDVFAKNFQIKRIFKIQSALIPVFDPAQKTVNGNKAIVGDAAGQVKATTGGGIIFGCKCAELLAKAVELGDLSFYEKEWRKEYGRDLKTHLMVRRFLNKVDYNYLFSWIKKKKLDRLIEEYGDMDYPGKLLKQIIKRPSLWSYLPKFFFASL